MLFRSALALVNRDGSTGELLELADEIREAVAGRFGVRLEREPVLAEPDGREDGGPRRGMSDSEPSEEAQP